MLVLANDSAKNRSRKQGEVRSLLQNKRGNNWFREKNQAHQAHPINHGPKSGSKKAVQALRWDG